MNVVIVVSSPVLGAFHRACDTSKFVPQVRLWRIAFQQDDIDHCPFRQLSRLIQQYPAVLNVSSIGHAAPQIILAASPDRLQEQEFAHAY
jgi:hypothetical protein